jgi:hypothetical protein
VPFKLSGCLVQRYGNGQYNPAITAEENAPMILNQTFGDVHFLEDNLGFCNKQASQHWIFRWLRKPTLSIESVKSPSTTSDFKSLVILNPALEMRTSNCRHKIFLG